MRLASNGLGIRSFHTSSALGRSFKERRYRFGREKMEFGEDGTPKISGVSNKQYPMKVKWLRPEWITKVTQSPEGSGDCEGLPDTPPDAIPVHLRGSLQLEKVLPEIKDAISLKYQRHAELCYHVQDDLLSKIRRHDYDTSSSSAIITQLTVRIRNHQKELMKIAPLLNQPRKHNLKILIDVRYHYLKQLRETDYKEFEWLLEKLNIVYKEKAPYENIRRKEKSELLTDIWCDELRQYKLRKYQLELEKEQPKFLREKAEFLKFIMREEAELGNSSSVTQSEIDECLQKADMMDKSLDSRGSDIDISDFKIYEPEVVIMEKLQV
ncbi:RP-S15 [Lepeophtheirus salmonis]|nr:RP-S15 [Lepeophtheirus salmonis]CAF2973625.1 RP-S15 [Lepeophtheirus salmonis]